jgi:hypothetical protein
MMKRNIFILISLIAITLVFTGCLNTKTSVKVNTDGSGEITQTFLISNSLMSMMNSSAAEKAGTDSSATKEEESAGEDQDTATADSATDDSAAKTDAEPTPDLAAKLMDKEKLAKHAAEMGEGVTLVSADPYTEGDFSGYKAVYSFKDVSKLKINQNPMDLMPSDLSGSGNAPPDDKEYITFTFKKGSPAALAINMPALNNKSKTDNSKTGEKPKEPDASTLSMMKQIYKDMKINMSVEVQGTITDSNAQFKSGSAITLMDMDFNKILADDKSFNALAKSQVNTIEEMKALVKSVKGLKIELQKTVNVKFK